MSDPGKQARDRRYDRRRRETSNVRHLYRTPRWQRIRAETLARDSACVIHKRELGEIVPATICDHVEPHRNRVELFFRGPFQGLCKPCHDAKKQREERLGFSPTIGADGWPVDDRHPFNAASREKPE